MCRCKSDLGRIRHLSIFNPTIADLIQAMNNAIYGAPTFDFSVNY